MGSNTGGGVGSKNPSISAPCIESLDIRLVLPPPPPKPNNAPPQRLSIESFLLSGDNIDGAEVDRFILVAVSMLAMATEFRLAASELRESPPADVGGKKSCLAGFVFPST